MGGAGGDGFGDGLAVEVGEEVVEVEAFQPIVVEAMMAPALLPARREFVGAMSRLVPMVVEANDTLSSAIAPASSERGSAEYTSSSRFWMMIARPKVTTSDGSGSRPSVPFSTKRCSR